MRFALPLTRGVTLFGALALLHAPPALAAGGENTPLNLGHSSVAHAAGASSSSSGILRTIIALVVVVAVIYAVAKILRKVKGGEQRASGDGLTHLATLPLAPGKSMALVRSGRDIVLVGIGEHGVTPIKTYTEAEAIANGIDVPQETAPGFVDDDDRPTRGLLDHLRRMTVRS